MERRRSKIRTALSVKSFLLGALALLALLLVVSCGPVMGLVGGEPAEAPAARPQPTPFAASLTPAPDVPGDPARGREAFLAMGCGGCHTMAGVPGASGIVAPNLTNVALRPTLVVDLLENNPENMKRWIMDPPALKPGTAMPNLGASEQEAEDITAFLYSQPYNPPRR